MTINEGNKKIYETVYQQKALTEQILGIASHSFPFAKATYKAVCTEAIDFSMFDKVICGILQIDDVLSFEEIADILGLNVINHPEEGRYIDYGEKEIGKPRGIDIKEQKIFFSQAYSKIKEILQRPVLSQSTIPDVLIKNKSDYQVSI